MLPLSLLKTAQNHPMLVELKNGETYNGHLVSCDNWMNINLREVICTSRVSDFTGRMHCWTGGTVPSMTPLSNRTVTSSGECLSATSVAAPSSTCASLMRSLTWCGRRPPRAEGEGGHSSRSSRKAEAWAALAEVCLVAGAGVASQVRAEVKRRRSQGGKQASSEGTQPEQSPSRWASHQRLCMKPPAPTDSASCWSHRVSTYQAGLSLRSRLHTSSDMKIKGASEGPAVPSVTCRNSRSTCIYVSVHLSSGPAPRWESGADPALTRIK